MSDFNDFRVVLTRNIQARGTWDVTLEECPIDGLAGQMGSVQPTVTVEQLKQLRSRHGWPNLGVLKSIGQNVWQSLMTPDLRAAFIYCLNKSTDSKRGMRLVISIVGEEAEPAAPGTIRLQEIPLEALYFDTFNFLAPNPNTPISRSLKFKPDRDPQRASLPLRVLIVIATPTDKPKANMQEEKDAIQAALKNLVDFGGVKLEFCEPPTRARLAERLQEGFDILHFIGHGAFDYEGEDPSPRAYLCLEKEDHESDPIDAKTFEIRLQNSGVRLVVMTVCASAKPTQGWEPTAEWVQQTIGPFDGVAQTLVAGVSGVNAVVAMQFDLESEAAVVFSKTFYTQLLSSGRKLDEVVAICRREMIGALDAGHRAWVTPVVYWRCKDGKVFDVDLSTQERDEKAEKELVRIDTLLAGYLENLAWVRTMPNDFRNAALPEITKWRQAIEDLQHQRGLLLGETLRLHGGSAKSDGLVTCRLTVRLRTPAQVGDVNARILYPADTVSFVSAATGANTANAPFIQNLAPGEIKLLLQNASQGRQWTPDEYELAALTFRVQSDVTDPFLELKIADGKVQRDGVASSIEALNAVLFVS
jgi:CHAT domain-containing protein